MFPRLLSLVGRALAIAQLTQLRISIPVSGAPQGQVPAKCFPGGTSSQGLTSPRRVSFASSVTVLGDAPPLVASLDIIVQEPLRSEVVEEDDMDTGGATTDTSAPIIPPPPGFDNSHGHMSGEWAVIRPCSRLLRNSLAGSPGALGECRLICLRCRCRLSFRIAWMIL